MPGGSRLGETPSGSLPTIHICCREGQPRTPRLRLLARLDAGSTLGPGYGSGSETPGSSVLQALLVLKSAELEYLLPYGVSGIAYR
jgi:hypothetical protein